MSTSLPVVAAIPNYNHAEALGEMLPLVLEQEYDGVVVCDDKSTDGSLDLVAGLRRDIEVVEGVTNVGAGGNRNRIFESRVLEKLGEASIHFMDADTLLRSDRTPERVRWVMDRPNLSFVGGLARMEDGQQHFYNFGPPGFGPRNFLYGLLRSPTLLALQKLHEQHPELARNLRDRLSSWLIDSPNIFEPPKPQNVFWVIESNMIINSDLFRRFGGYDPSLRFHEIQDLAIKMSKKGLHGRFEPSIEVVQRAIDVRGANRDREKTEAFLKLMWRHKSFGTSWRKAR